MLKELANKKIKILKPCEQCGTCCKNKMIFLTPDEVSKIARYLNSDPHNFAEVYYDGIFPRIALKHKPDGSCIFLTEDNKCKIHEVKPFQCHTYPILFTPLVEKTAKSERDYYIFSCTTGKCVAKISKKDFRELTTLRQIYLMKAYSSPEFQHLLLILLAHR